MNHFRIELNYGKTGNGCEYLETEKYEQKDIDYLAIKLMVDNWLKISNRNYILHTPTKPLPTIKVVQIDNTSNRKLTGGIEFKTKWR